VFDHIKHLVLGTDCLTIIDYEDKVSNIYVTTDASDRRTGTMLSFGETWETARPVTYVVFESQVHRTEKRPWTQPNRTDGNRTFGCGCHMVVTHAVHSPSTM
jgi:hypothetical protein